MIFTVIVSALHLYRHLLTSGHPALYNIAFIHLYRHLAVRDRCLAQGHLDTRSRRRGLNSQPSWTQSTHFTSWSTANPPCVSCVLSSPSPPPPFQTAWTTPWDQSGCWDWTCGNTSWSLTWVPWWAPYRSTVRHRVHQLYAGLCKHPPLSNMSPLAADIVTLANVLFLVNDSFQLRIN